MFAGPTRQQRCEHPAPVGYARELTGALAIIVDYIHSSNRDMFLARNLNPMLRVNTTRTGALSRIDAFGVLGEPYTERVWVDRKSTRLNSSHLVISYAVFCLKKKMHRAYRDTRD